MNQLDAMNDLKAIREIMNRTRKTEDGRGGWMMILWGIIWVIGFGITQFSTGLVPGITWLALNTIGFVITVWLAVNISRGGVHSPMWRVILLWWLTLCVFDFLIIWLLKIEIGPPMILLIILTVALGYIQFGLFTHWMISAAGLVMATLVIASYLAFPAYFFLSIGLIGGGVLIVSGAWLVRQGR
jgi:hypothetical protein